MFKKDKTKSKKKCKNENDQKKELRSDAAVWDGESKMSGFSQELTQNNISEPQYEKSSVSDHKSTNPAVSYDVAKQLKKKKRKRGASDSEQFTEATKEPKQKFKTKKGCNASDDSETDQPVEGWMVPHPKLKGEQMMVLVDRKRLKVFSALKRTENGDMIPIGSLVSGNVVIDDRVLSEDEGRSLSE